MILEVIILSNFYAIGRAGLNDVTGYEGNEIWLDGDGEERSLVIERKDVVGLRGCRQGLQYGWDDCMKQKQLQENLDKE